MKSYNLVNPVILGGFNTVFKAENELSAAETFWNKLSPFITNNLPKFMFTLQEGGNLHHFVVKESVKEGSKVADFTIDKVNISLSSQQKQKFLNEANSVSKKYDEQTGGRRRRYIEDDSSSSSSSDDDYFNFFRLKKLNTPITYWWYAPTIYYPTTTTVYTPTFNIPLTPYVQLWWTV